MDAVLFDELSGVAVESGSGSHVLTKLDTCSLDEYDAIAISIHTIGGPGDSRRGISFTFLSPDATFVIGLKSHTEGRPQGIPATQGYADIEFAVGNFGPTTWLGGRRWTGVIELGSCIANFDHVSPGDKLDIALNSSGCMEYRVNGRVLYESRREAAYPLRVKLVAQSHGKLVSDLRWIGQSEAWLIDVAQLCDEPTADDTVDEAMDGEAECEAEYGAEDDIEDMDVKLHGLQRNKESDQVTNSTEAVHTSGSSWVMLADERLGGDSVALSSGPSLVQTHASPARQYQNGESFHLEGSPDKSRSIGQSLASIKTERTEQPGAQAEPAEQCQYVNSTTLMEGQAEALHHCRESLWMKRTELGEHPLDEAATICMDEQVESPDCCTQGLVNASGQPDEHQQDKQRQGGKKGRGRMVLCLISLVLCVVGFVRAICCATAASARTLDSTTRT